MLAVEEYLHTSFPGVDCEIPGWRTDRTHAAQARAGSCFSSRRKELSLFAAFSTS
jgi:hypothetical protein